LVELLQAVLCEQHLVCHVGKVGECQFRYEPVYVFVVRLVALVTHIENRLTLLREEYVGADEDVVCINAKIVAASADVAAQFDELLKKPSAAFSEVERFGTEAQYCALFHKGKPVLRTEKLHTLVIGGDEINILDGVLHLPFHTLDAERQCTQVFCYDRYHHVNRFPGGSDRRKCLPGEEPIS
jgi:hypothetical protein